MSGLLITGCQRQGSRFHVFIDIFMVSQGSYMSSTAGQKATELLGMVVHPVSKDLGGWGRRVRGLRAVWTIWWVWGQPDLDDNHFKYPQNQSSMPWVLATCHLCSASWLSAEKREEQASQLYLRSSFIYFPSSFSLVSKLDKNLNCCSRLPGKG